MSSRDRRGPSDVWFRPVGDLFHLVVGRSERKFETACGLMIGGQYDYQRMRRGHWPDDPSCRSCIALVRSTTARVTDHRTRHSDVEQQLLDAIERAASE